MKAFAVFSLFLLGLVVTHFRAAAQSPDAEPTLGLPMVTFEMDWRNEPPRWYSISIDSTGRAAYQSEPAVYPGETAGDPYLVKFTCSDAIRDHVFRLTRELGYFDLGNYQVTSNSAQATTKTLRWEDTLPNAERDNQATYNSSNNPKVNELTSIFERISRTIEAGRRLNDAVPSDTAAIEDELVRMERMKRQNQLLEFQVVQPLVRSVADNPAVAVAARRRARRLLATPETLAAK
jgi:hypothetical protein